MAEKSRHKEKAYPLRIPSDLRNWIQEQANKNERSLNSEIKLVLKNYRMKKEAA